jgi:RNA polymerase sigma-70 factor, ECF subfamily
MSGNTTTPRIFLPRGLMAAIPTLGHQGLAQGAKRCPSDRPIRSRHVTVWRNEGTISQRAEEPVPVSLSPPLTAEHADLALRFHELMLPHLDAAYNLARYLLRDPVAAEDVAQDAFLRAFRAFEGYRGGDPKAWIMTIVRNCCHSWAKAAASDLTVPIESIGTVYDEATSDQPDCCARLIDPADSPEATVVRQNEIATMRELIENLPIPFRETLVLRELEELSYQEIAETTGTPIGTVMSRLARARHLLEQAWRRRTADREETRS